MKNESNTEQIVKLIKDRDREQFIDNRDFIKIMEEKKEEYRRRQVLSGEWKEEESH